MNDIISYVLLSREKFMAIDVEYFLLEYKKIRKQGFNSELFSLEKGLEAVFNDFLILYEDYYIASSSEKKTSK